MRLAVAQLPVSPAPLDRIRALAAMAAAGGAELLVLPQRSAHPNGDWAAEPSDGPLTRALRALAAETGIALLFGYAEACSGQVHDSLQLVDRGGRAIANYRRSHLDRADRGRFAPGHWLSAMPLGNRRLGLLSGYDLAFPEPARALRLAGCDLLLVAGGAADDAPTVDLLLPARALENRCCLAFASARADQPARILGPDGHPLARLAGSSPLLLADLPTLPEAALHQHLADRRPRLYQRLTAQDAVEA